jgi:hypothetical protein
MNHKLSEMKIIGLPNLKILLQKYEYLFDVLIGEFNMEPISLQ